MAKKRIKKTDAEPVQPEPAAAEPAAPVVVEKKKRKEPTQKEVDEGVRQAAKEIEEAGNKAMYLHGKAKAGFALMGLMASIRKAGGSAEAGMKAVDALHDDWIEAAMRAIHEYECVYGLSFDPPCDECGGPTCEEHDIEDEDAFDE